jgi:exodeoxyribonuclease V alpha subunit
VTRARELVVLVGDRQVLEEMTHNERETGRNSGLEEKLRRCGSDVL